MNDCLLVGLLILDSAIQFLILNEIVITSALNLMTLKDVINVNAVNWPVVCVCGTCFDRLLLSLSTFVTFYVVSVSMNELRSSLDWDALQAFMPAVRSSLDWDAFMPAVVRFYDLHNLSWVCFSVLDFVSINRCRIANCRFAFCGYWLETMEIVIQILCDMLVR